MPTGSSFPPLIYLGVLALGLGLFMILAGFDIVKVEKVTVKTGRTTWGLGLFLIVVGIGFLYLGGILKSGNEAASPTPATTLASIPASAPASTPVTEAPPISTAASSTETALPATDMPDLSRQQLLRQRLNEAKAWKPVLLDGFDSNYTNWDLAPLDSEFTLQNKEISGGLLKWDLEIRQNASFFLEIAPVDVPLDFYYSARLRRIAQPDGQASPGARWGLFFRRQGYNGYAFLISDKNEYMIGRFSAPESKWYWMIEPITSQQLKVNEFNTLAVIVEGGHMTFYLNGEPIDEKEDATLTSGNVGIYSGLDLPNLPSNLEIDDFELRAAP